jgi:hypothetical protein
MVYFSHYKKGCPMKNSLLLSAALLASASAQANVELNGQWNDTQGSVILTPNSPLIFASATNPDGTKIILGVELVEETQQDASLRTSLLIVSPDNTKHEELPQLVRLPFNSIQELVFDTPYGIFTFKLRTSPSFMTNVLALAAAKAALQQKQTNPA